MNCVFQSTTFDDNRCLYVCQVCGRKLLVGCHKTIYADCGEAKVEPKSPQIQQAKVVSNASGPGTELKSILSWIQQLESTSCQCTARARVMDKEGPDWCEQNQEIITGWLMEEWDQRSLSLADFLPAKMRRFAAPLARRLPERAVAERGARWAIKLAIKRARSKEKA